MVDVTLSLIGANGDEIVFSDEGSFVLTSGLTGLGIPATQVRIDDSASDGGVWRFSKRGVREMDLPVVVFGADRAEVEVSLRRLSTLLHDRDGGVVLQAAYSSGEVWQLRQGHYVAGASGVRGDDAGLAWERWVVSLQFADPFWVSAVPESFSVGTPSSSGTLLPNLAELAISSSQAVGSVTVENPGDVDAYPVWSLRGPADSVTISNGSDSFVYDAPIGADSTVVVDTQAGTVTDQVGVNKYGLLGTAPSLFSFPAGVSQVSVTAVDASAGAWTDVETLATNLVTNPSMEASSGTVTVRTNLVTNPSMESVTSGSVVMRRNLLDNPNFEVDTSFWSSYRSATLTRDTSEKYIGTASLKVVTTPQSNNSGGPLINRPNGGAGKPHIFSAWVKAPAGELLTIYASNNVDSSLEYPFVATGSWQRVSAPAVLASGTATIAGIIWSRNTASSVTFYVDAAMIEASSVVGDYFDGSTSAALGWTYAWSGTANASIATASSAATTVRTNLAPNPSVEVGTTGWQASGATIARVTTQAYVGTASLEVTGNTSNGAVYDITGLTASQTYTASVWVKGTAGDNVRLDLNERVDSSNSVATTLGTTTTLTGSWQRLSVTRTFGATGVYARLVCRNISTTMAGPTYWDAVLFEASSTLGDYFDGSFNPAGDFSYAWTGTANASTSIQRGATVSNYYASGGSTTYQSTNVPAVVGSKTVAMRHLGTADSYVQMSNMAVTAGTTYALKVSARVQTGRSVPLFAICYNSGGSIVSGGIIQVGSTTLTSGVWGTISGTVVMPATTVNVSIWVGFGTRTAGEVDYADAYLLEASPIVQDYFDGSIVSTDNDLTNSWSGTAHASTSLIRGVGVAGTTDPFSNSAGYQSTQWALTGSKSVRITPITANGDTFVSPGGDVGALRLGMAAGTTYTVSGTIRLTAAQTGTPTSDARKIVVFTRVGTGAYVSTGSTQAPNAAGTTRLSLTFNVPAGATEAFIRLYNGASAGNGNVWWDDLILVAGTYTGDYFDGNSTTLRENGYAWTGTANASTSTWTRREIQGATLISCNYQPRKEIVH